MTRIRIALADDQAIVLEGLKSLLSTFPELDVVIEAGNGEALLEALASVEVDVVVSDIRMPGLDGIATLKALRARELDIPVIMLTTFDDSDLLLAAAEAGARGFLLKDASPEDLVDAIRRVHAGETVLKPIPVEAVRERYSYAEHSAPAGHLTDRETSILRLLAGGYSNKEIARSLFLAEGTVKNYVSDILDKLGTRDRTRAVLKAITLRLI